MGLTHIDVTLSNPEDPKKAVRLTFLVDSGSAYSVVPKGILRRLGIKPRSTRTFLLADGTKINRRIGNALFLPDKEEGASPVIFGERDDSVLLGTLTLEALGFILDPFKRELRRLPLLL